MRPIRLLKHFLDAHELIDQFVELKVGEGEERHRPKILSDRHYPAMIDGGRYREFCHTRAHTTEGLTNAEQDFRVEIGDLNPSARHSVDALHE